MCDGYLHQKQNILTLHTEGFTQEETQIASRELTLKVGLHTQVMSRRAKYFVIQLPTADAFRVRDLVTPYMLECFSYKIPKP
jgi:hypothetical protein